MVSRLLKSSLFNFKDGVKILRSWSIMFGLDELEFRLDGEGRGREGGGEGG